MAQHVKRSRTPQKPTQPASDAADPVAETGPDPGGRLAIGLMVGAITIIALLTLAIVISIP